MDFYKDTWYILDEYFKTNYFLTKHHLDSYNDFVLNKLPNTIRVLNPFIIIKNQDNGAITHEINVYIGGYDGTEIFFNKPTIINEKGEQRLMYPNEARLKDMTYKAEIFANITIKYTTREEATKKESTHEEIFNNMKIGSIPIMLHSCLCVLNNQTPNVLHEMGECIYDQGGYFVMDGKEKVIVAQERITTNRIFINKSKDPKYSHEGLIRCTSEENPLFPKTINIYVHADRHKKKEKDDSSDDEEEAEESTKEKKPKEDVGADKLFATSKIPSFAIVLSSPNITNIKVPLFVLFRALGVESDKEIIEMILYDVEDQNNKALIDFLRYSVLHGSSIMTQQDAIQYLSNFVEYKSVDKVKSILINDLFPNVGIEFRNKALFLGHIINKLIKVALGITKESDRDSYLFKRVDISGFLMANLFRDYYNQFRQTVRNTIDRQYLYGPWRTLKNINNMINKSNLNVIFQAQIVEDGMRKSLKGSWGVNMVEEQQDADDIKQGIVQDLSRISYLGFISHLRRVNTPMDPTSKIVAPHRLHPSQWGIMCPCESPDGGSIGLLKNMAILCKVTFDTSAQSIIQCLKEFGMIMLNNIDIESVRTTTKILVNSNWVGSHDDPVFIFKLLKLLKKNALINIFTSVSWDIFQNEINILTEAGRCCRPLYVVDKSKLLIEDYISDLKTKKLAWNDLITGSSLKNVDVLDYNYISPKKVFGNIKNDALLTILEKNQAPIEFIDVEEANCSYIAMEKNHLSNNPRYTHCELHASTIFSVVTHNIPLANFNQAPRNIFSGAQGKQAIGCYATNYLNRIDTMSYVLHYPQRCLLNTRYCEYLNLNRLPNGENLIVAFASYTGYNMEDSIIINRDSIERGMFNLTYYKNVVDREEENKKDNEVIKFNNPKTILDQNKTLNELKWANYKKLDVNGFPILNSYISEGDALLGKTKIKTEIVEDSTIQNNIFGNKVKKEVYYDRSMIADKTMSGTVDKVYLYVDDEGQKTTKIRFRKIRIPEFGDKCCCYDEETEILTDNGWKFFKDLTLEDKVATMVNDALVYQHPVQLQCYDFYGKLYDVDSKQVNLRVTDNHRMYIRNLARKDKVNYIIKEAKDIYRKQVHYKKNVNNWTPELQDAPPELLIDNGKVIGFMIDGYTETLYAGMSNEHERENEDLILDIEPWLTFFGIWIAEGYITDISNGTRFAAHKPRVKAALDKVCEEMGFKIHKINEKKETEPNSWRIYDRALSKYMLPFSVGGNNKYLPEWVWYLNREQCRILIHGMLLGDGDFGTVKQGRYYTTSTVLADQFQRLCLHAGFSANKLLKYEAGHEVPGVNGGPPIVCHADYWVLSVIDKQNEPKVNKYMYNGKQKYDGQPNDSWVDYNGKVRCCTVPEGDGIIYVRRKGFVVWSGNSRDAQKGTIGMIIPRENMPFTKDGIVPDMIINPHAVPSRMTIAHLLEKLLGKVACCKGSTIDGTPFNNNDYSDLYTMMEKDFKLERHGNEIMYNGFTGDQIGCDIFMGPIFYERLKHMVADKINYRQVNLRTIYNNGKEELLKDAPVNVTTRQPTKGRGNNGGLRIGEMEKDSIMSHGMMGFLKESLMERSDKYSFNIDNDTHTILHGDIKDSHDVSKVETPYSFKQLVHEVTGLSIKPILYTDPILEDDQETYDDSYIDMLEIPDKEE